MNSFLLKPWLRFAASWITQPTYKIELICSPRPLVTGDSALPTQHVKLPLPSGFKDTACCVPSSTSFDTPKLRTPYDGTGNKANVITHEIVAEED